MMPMGMGQGWLFIYSVAMGVAIGIFYDVFRVFRKVASHKNWVVQIEDTLFWLCATTAMFFFILSRGNGEMRLVYLVASVCGALLYFATISRFVLNAAVVVTQFIHRVLVAVIRILLLPLGLLHRALAPPVRFFALKLNNCRKNLRIAAKYGKIKKATRSLFIMRKKV